VELDHWLAQTPDFDAPKSFSFPLQAEEEDQEANLEADDNDHAVEIVDEKSPLPMSGQAAWSRIRPLHLCAATILFAILFTSLGYYVARFRTAQRVASVQRLTFQRGMVRTARP
jgi:hypothetical protein